MLDKSKILLFYNDTVFMSLDITTELDLTFSSGLMIAYIVYSSFPIY